jgi:small subunit ribosomal protein S20
VANTSSAKKAIRKIARRTQVNKARVSRMRSSWRGVEEAIAKGDSKAALAALREAESQTMRAAGSKVVHKNTASRKVARLTKRVKAIGKA